ncbi:AraC-like DNA-binding protein [Flavobacterium sp. 28A]|uniref:helix-turn-helix domain-containing protein n=1 Tax=Flavobacterium sp. 28A TaxID=2735895 RepID=UPI001C2D507B|nr:AraC family transcriptional regulator [Flavobacterium sp. 28A]NRT14947.1 AraC-like DNA-binding protein [Flavobacterium sp. 28A]
MATNDILTNSEFVLKNYFSKNSEILLPTVDKVAKDFNASPAYLSDMLRSMVGQNTQQHIHNKLIEKGKDILAGTQMSVSEIAFLLEFDHPQSFSKLFKNKFNTHKI